MPQSSADLIQQIIALAPDGSAGLDGAATETLKVLTRRLLAAREAEGGLDEDPLELAMTRNVELHRDAALARLAGRRILVTGGAGSVGTRLRQLLQGFGPAALFSLDIAPHHGEGVGITADIRDMAALDAAFREARPEVVFHLAASRAGRRPWCARRWKPMSSAAATSSRPAGAMACGWRSIPRPANASPM
ncbi:MAG: hypothetical protein DI532_07720 [Azospirillum brasilense]|nr:MAG: hypothetical protein DI532_07720 [Azospirillum brasilense]